MDNELTYSITLADGTVIDKLYLNGTNYVSKVRIDESVFTEDNLKEVVISNGETDTAYDNLEFTQQMEFNGEYYLAFYELSQAELENRELKRTVEYLDTQLSDTQIALVESYEENLALSEEVTATQLALVELFESMEV